MNVTFPEQYQAEELAGKAATFKVKLHEVKTKELPAADDEFAKDVSEYDTLDELKASIRKGMEEQNEKNAELEVENDLVEQIVATLEGDVPPVMFERAALTKWCAISSTACSSRACAWRITSSNTGAATRPSSAKASRSRLRSR